MNRNNDLIYKAVANLESIIDIPIDIETSRVNYDAILNIKNHQFIVEAKSAMRSSNQGVVLSQLENIKNISSKPIILIADYISKEATTLLKERGFNYIDTAGNAFISHGALFIQIVGQKKTRKLNTNQSRAFQEAGIKIIFHLLSDPKNLKDSYREIAQSSGVSLGSVSYVMSELEDLNYLLRSNNNRILKNKVELLERWVVEFNTVLKPRIIRSRMKFIDQDIGQKWHKILQNQREILWGGEPAAALLTNRLKPEIFTIYSDLDLPEIAKALRLVPDNNGNVEVCQKFWINNETNLNITPALLIYTDLINSGYGRNVEIANEILENELQHIQ